MSEDVYEPLSRYRDEFREKFARLAEEKFEELKNTSGVNVEANIALVAEIRRLQKIKAGYETKRMLWELLSGLLILLAIAGVIAGFYYKTENFAAALFAAAPVCLLLLFFWTLPAYKKVDAKIAELSQRIEVKINDAWQQMAPLNALFDWHITAELIEKTVPRIQFDRFFTEARLQDLRESFGWDDSFNDDLSVVHTHSGVINENPFVFAELRRQEWIDKTYYGQLEITWLERERDSEGKYRTVRRYQTLTATIERPAPAYVNEKVLIFGNDAAPNLDFSRGPSDLSGAEKGLWNSIKRSHRLGKLEKLARNLDAQSFIQRGRQGYAHVFFDKGAAGITDSRY